MDLIKWQLNSASCNFGLKSYLWFWNQTKLHSTQFNYHHICHLNHVPSIFTSNFLPYLVMYSTSVSVHVLFDALTWSPTEQSLIDRFFRRYLKFFCLKQNKTRYDLKWCFLSWNSFALTVFYYISFLWVQIKLPRLDELTLEERL